MYKIKDKKEYASYVRVLGKEKEKVEDMQESANNFIAENLHTSAILKVGVRVSNVFKGESMGTLTAGICRQKCAFKDCIMYGNMRSIMVGYNKLIYPTIGGYKELLNPVLFDDYKDLNKRFVLLALPVLKSDCNRGMSRMITVELTNYDKRYNKDAYIEIVAGETIYAIMDRAITTYDKLSMLPELPNQ